MVEDPVLPNRLVGGETTGKSEHPYPPEKYTNAIPFNTIREFSSTTVPVWPFTRKVV